MKGYIVEFSDVNTNCKGSVKDKILMLNKGIAVTGYIIEVYDYLEVGGLWKAYDEPYLEAVLATDIIRIIT